MQNSAKKMQKRHMQKSFYFLFYVLTKVFTRKKKWFSPSWKKKIGLYLFKKCRTKILKVKETEFWKLIIVNSYILPLEF